MAALPPFHAAVAPVSQSQLGASWHPGCPVGAAELRLVRVSYVGFDGKAHRGAIVVNESVVPSVERVFARLYAERFPIRRMIPIAHYGGNDFRSMAADNTSGFNCRYVVGPGPKRWSVHAYGEAIDVDTVQNPYLVGAEIYPPAGRRYADRADVRPGMAVPGGELVDAFASVGWQWGGRWTASPDYQHFSSTGG
jgi:D-alanyl-D-alanine carboxypeptidase